MGALQLGVEHVGFLIGGWLMGLPLVDYAVGIDDDVPMGD
jgi:hypothetical protein